MKFTFTSPKEMNSKYAFIYAFAALLLGGCSRMASIVIINVTDAPVFVEYTVNVLPYQDVVFNKPHINGIHFFTIEKDGDEFAKTASVPNKTLHVDTLTNYVSFHLFPNELVEIGDLGNDFVKHDNLMKFNLKNIKITMKDSSTIYAEGDHARHLFHYNKSSGKQLVFE